MITILKHDITKIKAIIEQRAAQRGISIDQVKLNDQLKEIQNINFDEQYKEDIHASPLVNGNPNFTHLNNEVSEIVRRQIASMGFNPNLFEVVILDSTDTSASVYRFDNKVFMTLGFIKLIIDKGGSKDHLAQVIGHELRHIYQWADDVLDGKKINHDIHARVSSHSDEYDSDYMGLMTLELSGYNVQAAVDVMRMLPDDKFWRYVGLTSHPPMKERIRRLERTIRNNYWKNYSTNLSPFSAQAKLEAGRHTQRFIFRSKVDNARNENDLLSAFGLAVSLDDLNYVLVQGLRVFLIHNRNTQQGGDSSLIRVWAEVEKKYRALNQGNVSYIHNLSFTTYKINMLERQRREGIPIFKPDDLPHSERQRAVSIIDIQMINARTKLGQVLRSTTTSQLLDLIEKEDNYEAYVELFGERLKNEPGLVSFNDLMRLISSERAQKNYDVHHMCVETIFEKQVFWPKITVNNLHIWLNAARRYGNPANHFMKFLEKNSWALPITYSWLKQQNNESVSSQAFFLEILTYDMERVNNGSRGILFFNANPNQNDAVQTDVQQLFQYKVFVDMLEADRGGRLLTGISPGSIFKAFEKKYGLPRLHSAKLAELILQHTRSIQLNILEYWTWKERGDFNTIELYELLFDFILKDEESKGSPNAVLGALQRFFAAGGILGPNDLLKLDLNGVDKTALRQTIFFLGNQEQSVKKRLVVHDSLKDRLKYMADDWWGRMILSLESRYLFTSIPVWMENNLIRVDRKESLFSVMTVFDNIGDSREWERLYERIEAMPYKADRFQKDSEIEDSQENDPQSLINLVLSDTKTADDLLRDIKILVPRSVGKNMLLYSILLKKLKEYGVRISDGASPDRIDFKYLQSEISKLNNLKQQEIKKFIDALLPDLIPDKQAADLNKFGLERAYRQGAIPGGLPSIYNRERMGYPDILFSEVGGLMSQINIFVAKLNEKMINQIIESQIPFDQKLKPVLDSFPPCPTRDLFLRNLIEKHQGLTSKDILMVLPELQSPDLRDKYALRGLDLEIEANGRPNMAKAEVDLIVKYFPKPSYTRDDLLNASIERWVHRPEQDIMTPLLLDHPENIRKGYQNKMVFGETIASFIAGEEDPVKRAQFLLWVSGAKKLEDKPDWLKAFEYRYKVSVDSLRESGRLHSRFYPKAGQRERKRFIQSMLYGNESILENTNSRNVFLEELFNGILPNNKDPLLRDTFDSIFSLADLSRQETIVEALLGLLGENDTVVDKEQKMMGIFLQSLGVIGTKTGQALNIEGLHDRADPIPRDIVFNMIAKVYGSFDRFDGIYERMGQASIKNVFRAVLKGGREIVLKAKRPDIEKTIQQDIVLFEKVINDLQAKGHILPTGLVGRVKKMLADELNFNGEIQNQKIISTNIQRRAGPGKYVFHVPMAIEPAKENVIILEDIVTNGIPLNDTESLRKAGIDPQELRQKVKQEIIKQMLEDGVYHFDPQGGNIIVIPPISGRVRVSFIDIGSLGYLNPSNRLLMGDLLMAIQRRASSSTLDVFTHQLKLSGLKQLKLKFGLFKILNSKDSLPQKVISVLTFLDENGVKMDEEIMSTVRAFGAARTWWGDQAMASPNSIQFKKGGIDLSSLSNSLSTKSGDGSLMRFKIDLAMLEQLKNAPGFVPVIINIQPINDLQDFLGLNNKVAAKKMG